MSAVELIERLTALVMFQADIIQEQASALAQLEAATATEDKIEQEEKERIAIIGE